jgi:signal peptide peptidase SppA
MRGLHILSALESSIWAMDPLHLSNMAAVLRRWSTGASASPEVMSEVHAAQAARKAKQSAVVGGGIAVMSLSGIIAPKSSAVDEISGGGTTSLQAFGQAFDEAVADNSIGAIILNFDTPGGNVVMTPETADKVLQARKTKPVYGYVEGLCASAGYWIASCCTELYSTPSASIGSIGVYTSHVDASAAMEKAGIKEEFISAGTYKLEGNSNGPLSPEGRAFTQTQIGAFFGMFTGDVAKGRGVPVASVRSGYGQGRCLLAADALAEGMIDGICSFDDVVAKARKAIKSGGARASVDVADIVAGELVEIDAIGEGHQIGGFLEACDKHAARAHTFNQHTARARLLEIAGS